MLMWILNLDFAAGQSLWSVQTDDSTSYSVQSDASTTWTEQTDSSDSWT